MSVEPRVDPGQATAEERAGRTVQWVLAVAGLVVGGRTGKVLEWSAVAVVIAIPLVRVAWLAVRWSRLRDWRYVAVAVLLLVLVAVGPIVALLQG
jgi:hypothetical protein